MHIDIQSRRKELGLTLEEVGKFVGVSKSTVKKWENGFIKNMKRDKILLLAHALQVSPLDILNISASSETNEKIFKQRELSLTSDYSLAVKKFFDTESLENTLIINKNNRAVCYSLSPAILDKIIIMLEEDVI